MAGLALLAVLLAVPTAWAFEGRGGDVITIGADEVIDDDLYVGAGEFTLDGTVKGDLFVAGSTIEINGTVEGDLVAAGQTVVVNGTVEDDVRIAGYSLVNGGQVADDLLTAGFSLENKSGSSVGGDLVSVGYQALLAGDVTGNADLAGGAVRIAGTIGGDVKVDVGGTEPGEEMPPGFPFVFAPNIPTVPSVPAGLTIDEGASIGGDLDYTAMAELPIPGGVVAGETDFTRYVPEVEARPEVRAPSPAALVGRWFLRQLRRLITLLLVGAFMMWVVPDWTRRVAGIVQSQPLPSLGWGVVAIAAFVMAMLVLVIATVLLAVFFGVVTLGELAGRFATLGGIVMGTVGFGFSITWSYVTRIVISLLLGQLIFRLFKSPAAEHRWWPMLVGVVIFVIITAVPVLGWLAGLAAVLLGLGAVWLWGRDWLRAHRPALVAVEAESPDV
jgi:cytoskeletal protein CcmA (bactofilin family)